MDFISELIEDYGYQAIIETILISLILINTIILIIRLIRNPKKPDKSSVEKYLDKRQEERDIAQSYIQKKILTYSENEFYKQLKEELIKYDVNITCKVNLSDIFQTKKPENRAAGSKKLALTGNVDFLITDEEGNALTAIKLLDNESEKERDFINSIFMHKDIKYIKIQQTDNYDFKEIKSTIRDYMNVDKFLAERRQKNK